jgi:predicted nucleotidyltransferase
MRPAHQSFLRYPLNVVFDTPANVRVLRALARHGGMLSASALVGASGLTKPSVLSALRQLNETGTVEIHGSDRQRLYRLNEASSLASIVNTLFMAESERYGEVIKAVRTSAEKSGAEAAWIYGSVARGEDRPESDIDVVVTGRSDKASDITAAMREGLLLAGRLLGFSASVIGIDDNEIKRLERERDPWWLGLRRDAIVVMGPAPEPYLDKLRRKRRKPR